VLTRIHAGVSVEEVVAATGWPLKVSADLQLTEPPSRLYLDTMRDLQARSARAHAGDR